MFSQLPKGLLLTLVVLGVSPLCGAPQSGKPAPPLPEKESRTPAQRKINSQLLQEIYRRRGEAKQKQVPAGKTDVRIDDKGRALVDVRADVTPALEDKLRSFGGTIVSSARAYRSVIAWLPLLELERLAEDPAVHALEPAAEARTAR